jgi:YegS/Rv2252/BmrU family lipid kinase
MTVVIVANPTSGRGKGAKLIPRVEEKLRELGVPFEMRVSAGPEEPERLAREAASGGASVVAALGGDGHVGLCANGLLGSEAALAVIPAGTGNDFARHIGLDRKDPVGAAAFLAHPVTRRLDVVRVLMPQGERHYLNVGGTGFDSDANELANRTHVLTGTAKYVYAVLVTLARFHAGRFHLVVDGREHDLAGMMVAVGNGVSYGGGMRITPNAVSDDGLLDLTVVGEVSKPEFVRTFPKVFKGTHLEHPAVTSMRGREIAISAERPFEVYGDGEHLGSLPATFTVMPAALDVVVPPGR